MNIIETIRTLCAQRGIPVSKVEKDLGYGNGFLNPKKVSTIPSDRLLAICDYLDVSADALLHGEIKKRDPVPDEISEKTYEFIRAFSSLPPERQDALLLLLQEQPPAPPGRGEAEET